MTVQTQAAPPTRAKVRSVSIFRNLIAAPFIYAVLLPLLVLDVMVSLYQAVCFRLWRLPRVARRDHMRIDRHKLAYLSPLQKLNCIYCGYANGVLGFAREVAARSEQYWCPIQHETPPAAPHHRYPHFVAYGDSHDLAARWRALRAEQRSWPTRRR